MNRRSFFGALAGLPLAGCASMPTEQGQKFIDKVVECTKAPRKISYCTDNLDLWGQGKGRLYPAEIDLNFYHLDNRLLEIEDALAKPRTYNNGYFYEEYPPLLPRKWSKDQL